MLASVFRKAINSVLLGMMATKAGYVVMFMLCNFCYGEEPRCSRYHYEEQTLAKVVRLEHKLETMEEQLHARPGYVYLDVEEIALKLDRINSRLEQLEQRTAHPSPSQGCASCASSTHLCCPDGWMRYLGSCYLFVEKKQTFDQSRTYCHDHDAQLVHIDNADENSFIVQHLRTLKEQHHWIGLTDVEAEGTFKWEDGTEMTFSYWYNAQPDNGSGREDCVQFRAPYNYMWNDQPCSSLLGSICEKLA